VRARTTEVRDLVAVALDDVRKLAFELRPTVLDDVGLVAALRRLAHDMSGRFGVPIALSFDGVDDDHRLAPEIETVVYRVVQEALTNVARHSRATRAHVSVGRHESELQVTVGDDGTGFDLDAPRAQSLGLSGMAERATLVGGRLGIRTAPGEGTWVTLEVPA
jgi:signal transduction histidine kinase